MKFPEFISTPEFIIGTIISGIIINLFSSFLYGLFVKNYEARKRKKKIIDKTLEEKRNEYIEERVNYIGKNSQRLGIQLNLVTYYQSIIRSYFTFGAVFYVCGAVLAMFSTNETGVMNIILIVLAIAGIFVGHILLAIMVKGLYSTLFLQRYILDIALRNNGIKLFNKEKIRREIKSQVQN